MSTSEGLMPMLAVANQVFKGYYGSVLLEALVVGGILAAMMSIVVVLYPITGSSSAAFRGFFLGALTHILFEASRANAWYCKNGAACLKTST